MINPGIVKSVSLTGASSGDGAILDGVTNTIRATVTSLTNANPQAVAIVDGVGTQITSFGGGTQYADGAAAATPTGTQGNWNEAGTQRATSLVKPLPIQVGTGVTLPVSAASLPLPTGASTSALQTTGNTSIGSIDTKTPALGQALAASSVPVVLTAAQVVTLTPPAAITGFALEAGHLATIDTSTAKIPAQGQALAAASLPVVLTAAQQTALTPPSNTGYALDATLTGGTARTKITDGTNNAAVKAASIAAVATDPAVVVAISPNNVVPVSLTSTTLTGNVTVVQPTGTNLHAVLDTGSTTAVTQATGTNLHTVVDSGSITANAGTNLNTSALALDATLTGGTQQTKITDGTNIATVKAASTLPAATDKAIVVTLRESLSTPVTGTFFQGTQPVSGTVTTSPPANASTNIAQVNGVAVSTGTGIMGTGVQRVAISSDNDALTVKQATAANLNATVVGTGTFVTQSTLAAETTKVIGTVRNVGNVGGVFDAVSGAAVPANALLIGGGSIAGGTNLTAMTVKVASVLPALTDTAIVITQRDPLPVGANVIGKVSIDQTILGTTNAVSETHLPASAASADAFANPTITQMGAETMLFNGTSWDRGRGMSVATTTGDTGAKVATGNGANITNVGNKGIQIVIALGTVTGTVPTIVLKVQGSVDGGTTFYDVPVATTASLVATGNWGITIYPAATPLVGTTVSGSTAVVSNIIPRTWRMVWTIGGTTPSFTITSITYNYISN